MEGCEACGHENRKELIACEKCGSILENPNRKEQDSEKQRLKELLKLLEMVY